MLKERKLASIAAARITVYILISLFFLSCVSIIVPQILHDDT
jgi:hypothetical protein